MLVWLLIACSSNPCEGLSEEDCGAAEECSVTTARNCDGDIVYGGCSLHQGTPGCTDLYYEPRLHDGECKLYGAGEGCQPEELEQCSDSCYDSGFF